MTSFKDKIVNVFEKAESTLASHGTGIKSLRDLFTSNGKFKKYFTHLLKRVLASQKSDDNIERLMKFIVLFLTDREYDTDSHNDAIRNFSLYILNYLLDLTEANCKYVRWRSCKLIRGIIESFPVLELEYVIL